MAGTRNSLAARIRGSRFLGTLMDLTARNTSERSNSRRNMGSPMRTSKRSRRVGSPIPLEAQSGAGRNTPEQLRLAAEAKLALGGGYREFLLTEGRNKRSVWTVASQRYSDAHFATFPPKLIEPCILAGSARGDTVLDPFSGAGTTGLVASRLGREYIGIELNPEYIALAENRIKDDAPLFN